MNYKARAKKMDIPIFVSQMLNRNEITDYLYKRKAYCNDNAPRIDTISSLLGEELVNKLYRNGGDINEINFIVLKDFKDHRGYLWSVIL